MSEPPIHFDRQIRPILADSCFLCHGPDEEQRAAGLRLDLRDTAMAAFDTGEAAIVPGHLKRSTMWQRIVSDDPDLRMPPPDEPHQLTAAQIELLRQWIDQGATWDQHWSFTPIDRPELPSGKQTAWSSNAIDHFVFERLEHEGLVPSPSADKQTLLRRVTFDLIGIPPTPEEIRAFLDDRAPRAFDRVVDRLLSSPRYGERFATPWLDAARYADTNGHFMDNAREMWAWRDWVVRALNNNMPFDQFTIEQLAGDLLPDATQDQLIASGFHRNHGLNFEAGAIDDECRVAYVMDRINTTGTVWLGLTLGCAQCHDHKYDPLSQKEYFQLYAYFNNIDEDGVAGHWGNAEPIISLPSPNQRRELAQLEEHREQIALRQEELLDEVRSRQETLETEIAAKQLTRCELPAPVACFSLDDATGYEVSNDVGTNGEIDGVATWARGRFGGGLAFHADASIDCGDCLALDSSTPFTCSGWVFPTTTDRGVVFACMDDEDGLRGFDLSFGDGRLVARFVHDEENAMVIVTSLVPAGRQQIAWGASPRSGIDNNPEAPQERQTTAAAKESAAANHLYPNHWQHITITYDGSMNADGISIYIDGSRVETKTIQNNLTGDIETGVSFRIARRYVGGSFEGLLDDIRLFDECLDAEQAADLAAFLPSTDLLELPIDQRSEEENDIVLRQLADALFGEFSDLRDRMSEINQRTRVIAAETPTTMVMQERDELRPTHILMRGSYEHPQRLVTAGTPAFLPQQPADASANRLAFAKWLVQPDHPLTSRVAVNRAWQLFFGAGLVRTPGDFGVQGERPSHPELLDWLAAEFVANGWNVKALHRTIVTSATYCQSSVASSTLRERDPANRLLARMTRRRLSAEMLRDAALAYSGLIRWEQGGAGVGPYQPPGLWKENSFRDTYKAQQFEQSHGDALYRRSLYTFWKRTCPPPNMTTFDAPSREFCSLQRGRTNTPLQSLVLLNDTTYVEAARVLAARLLVARDSDDGRIEFAFEVVLSRGANSAERRVIKKLLEQQRTRYRQQAIAANDLLAVGESLRSQNIDPAELAAWTIVASTLMNLDEAVMRN